MTNHDMLKEINKNQFWSSSTYEKFYICTFVLACVYCVLVVYRCMKDGCCWLMSFLGWNNFCLIVILGRNRNILLLTITYSPRILNPVNMPLVGTTPAQYWRIMACLCWIHISVFVIIALRNGLAPRHFWLLIYKN